MHTFSSTSCAATLLISCSSSSVSLVFHKSFLLPQFSLQFLPALYQVDSAQVIFHLQLTIFSFCFWNNLLIHLDSSSFKDCPSINFEISCSCWNFQWQLSMHFLFTLCEAAACSYGLYKSISQHNTLSLE